MSVINICFASGIWTDTAFRPVCYVMWFRGRVHVTCELRYNDSTSAVKYWAFFTSERFSNMPTMLLGWAWQPKLSFICWAASIGPRLWYRDKHTQRCEILSRPGECMNYSLNSETPVCLMVLVMVTKRVWQPARTHKHKQHYLGQDGASSAGYTTLSTIKQWYVVCFQILYKLCVGDHLHWYTTIFLHCFNQLCHVKHLFRMDLRGLI